MLIFVFLIGTFVVNSLYALVLFDLGGSWYFISQTYSKDFDMTLGLLECPLRVSMSNKHNISDSSVFLDFTLEIF